MYYEDRPRVRRQLELQLQTGTAKHQLGRIRAKYPILREFMSWGEVVELLHDPLASHSVKDPVLRALLSSYQERGSQESGAVLLLAFWPALLVMAQMRAGWNDDDDELWRTLECAFLESALRLDVDCGPSDLAKRLIRDTGNRLRKAFRHEVAYRERRTRLPAHETLASQANRQTSSPVPGDDSKAAFVLVKQRLLRAYRGGLLTREELQLLSEIDYEGTTLEEAALIRGTSYEALKKRRQRLLAKVRNQPREN